MSSGTRRLLVAALLAPTVVAAQPVPTRTLDRPAARSAHEWTKVSAIRELSDGRVIVLDRYDDVIMLLDARLSSVTQIGRAGRGPGEFEMASGLVPLGGDSTGVLDNLTRSQAFKIITPAGEPGGILSLRGGMPCGAPGDTLRQATVSSTIDGLGRFYARAAPFRPNPGGEPIQVDSAAIERWGTACGRDTVGYLRHVIDPTARMVAGIGMISRGGPVGPFSTGDQWTVAADGRIVSLRPEPYRLDIIRPDRTRLHGPTVSAPPVRLTEAHKEAWRREVQTPVPVVRAANGVGSRTMMVMPFTEPESWPTTLPPFLYGALSVGLDGRAWVQRTTVADAPATFDLFDQAGRLTERVVFPPRSRLVGHGRGVVYIVRLDDDDLEYLERHPVGGR